MEHYTFEDSQYTNHGFSHTRHIARGIILDEDGRVYLHYVKRDDIFGKQGYYETPGGGIDEDETPEEALVRECQEELGFEVEVICPLAEVEDAYNLIGRKNINLYYLARKVASGTPHFASLGDTYIDHSEALSIEDAIAKMESNEDSGVAFLVKQRELPVLRLAKIALTK